MTFTFQNVWENRDAFIEACRYANACKNQFKRLIKAETEKKFMQVVYDNFNWICFKIADFEPKFDRAFRFYEGIALVLLNNKFGYINKDGTYLIEPKFNDAYDFDNGFALVNLKGKYGFINNNGSYLIEPKFDNAEEYFSEGLARVELNGKYGYIKNDGSYLAEPIFDKAFNFKNKNARVKLDGKHYNLDTDGNLKEIK